MRDAITRIETAINSLHEFLDGDWEGREGIEAVADSLQQALDELTTQPAPAELDRCYASVSVDLPNPYALGPDAVAIQVADFTTLRTAVAWVREHVGYCDDYGNMRIITCHDPIEPDED